MYAPFSEKFIHFPFSTSGLVYGFQVLNALISIILF